MRYPVCREYPKYATSSMAVAEIFRSILALEDEFDRDKEHFWVLGCNTKLRVKYIDLVSLGTVDASLVHPREVFRMAIHKGCSSIILGHNHPSGEIDPSSQDDEVTRRLVGAGKVLGIRVVDHIIVGDGYYSYAEKMRL